MKKINGVKLEKLDFDLTKTGDIIFYEGPFLSHFIDKNGNNFFMLWVDMDTQVNRWVLFRTNVENLSKYFNKKVNLQNLVLKNDFGVVYLLDIDKNANYKNTWIVETSKMPFEYIPQKNSFFDIEYASEYGHKFAITVKDVKKHHQRELISNPKYYFLESAILDLFDQSVAKVKLENVVDSLYNLEKTKVKDHYKILAMYFPLLIHYNEKPTNEYKTLLFTYSKALSNHLEYSKFLTKLWDTFLEKKPKENQKVLWNTILKSTEDIVEKNPQRYSKLYVSWKSTFEVRDAKRFSADLSNIFVETLE